MTRTQVRAVLLIPTEGDPLRLLAEGPCGARPPTVSVCSSCHAPLDRAERAGGDPEACYQCSCGKLYNGRQTHSIGALVLAWDGEVLYESIDRVGRRYNSCGEVVRDIVEELLETGLMMTSVWRAYVTLGTLVLLDEHEREVPSGR